MKWATFLLRITKIRDRRIIPFRWRVWLWEKVEDGK